MSLTWEISTLPNGLRVVTTPVPTAQSASVNFFVGAGSRAEDASVSGLAHFLEHMLFKGTARRPTAMAIAEAIEGAGGTMNAYTGREVTCYWNHVPYDRLSLALDVLADMIRSPLIDPEELARERNVVQQEIRRTQDQPGAWAMELLGTAMFGDQPLGRSITGTLESVASIQRQDFLDYMQGWYMPANLVISVAGRVSHEQVVKDVTALLADLEERPTPSFVPVNGKQPARPVLVEERQTAQAHLALGLLAISRTDPDRYILMVLNSLLGRGMSSRLFREVRERRGLAYSIGSSVARHLDTGVMAITAGVSPENTVETLKVIVSELYRLVNELVPEDELARARDYTIGTFRLGLETPMALGQRAGESLITMNEIEPVESVVEKLAAVSPQEIQRVAARLFRSEAMAVVAVGPGISEDALASVLAG